MTKCFIFKTLPPLKVCIHYTQVKKAEIHWVKINPLCISQTGLGRSFIQISAQFHQIRLRLDSEVRQSNLLKY